MAEKDCPRCEGGAGMWCLTHQAWEWRGRPSHEGREEWVCLYQLCTYCDRGKVVEPSPIDMIQELREAMGMYAGAMSASPSKVWADTLAEVRRIRRPEVMAETARLRRFAIFQDCPSCMSPCPYGGNCGHPDCPVCSDIRCPSCLGYGWVTPLKKKVIEAWLESGTMVARDYAEYLWEMIEAEAGVYDIDWKVINRREASRPLDGLTDEDGVKIEWVKSVEFIEDVARRVTDKLHVDGVGGHRQGFCPECGNIQQAISLSVLEKSKTPEGAL